MTTEDAAPSPAAAGDFKAERSMKKCDQCRAKKIKCSPVDRKWPEDGKCDACKKADLPCGPNLRKSAGTSMLNSINDTRTASPSRPPAIQTQDIDTLHAGALHAEHVQDRSHTGYERGDSPMPRIRSRANSSSRRTPLREELAYEESPFSSSTQRHQHSTEESNNNVTSPLRLPRSRANSPRKRTHEDAFENRLYKYMDVTRGGFRVLTLSPGITEPLRGSLAKVDLSQPTDSSHIKYEALSYTWGSGPPTSAIEIQMGEKVVQLHITPSLEMALKHLRSSQHERNLWVDQICINQTNMLEKSAQVARMGQIFREAQKVLVWLGEEDSETARTSAFVKRALNTELFESLFTSSCYHEDKSALLRLLQRPWFSRTWVIQEVALARAVVVYCGKHSILWEDLSTMISLFASQLDDVSDKLQSSGLLNFHPDFVGTFKNLHALRLVEVTTRLLRRDRLNVRPLLTLETLVSCLQDFDVSDDRDRLYALLSLASDVSEKHWSNPGKRLHIENPSEVDGFVRIDSLDISAVAEKDAELASPAARFWLKITQERTYPIDYSKSVYAVCKDFLTWILKTSSSIDVICQPWAPYMPLELLPSWMPSIAGRAFRRDGKGGLRRVKADVLVALPDGRKNYSASSRTQPECQLGFGSNEGVLSVKGFVLDTVGIKKLPAQAGNIPAEWLTAGGWNQTSQLPPDAFWRTLVADRGFEQENPSPYYPLACRQAYAMGVDGDDLRTDAQEGSTQLVRQFLRRVQSVVWQRCLIITSDEKLLGLVPYDANSGDLVCILYGCSVPVILRTYVEELTGNRRHQFIGECYIHSMMDGSAFRIRDKKLDAAKKVNPKVESLTETFHLR